MSGTYLVILNRWRFTGWKATAIFIALIWGFTGLVGGAAICFALWMQP